MTLKAKQVMLGLATALGAASCITIAFLAGAVSEAQAAGGIKVEVAEISYMEDGSYRIDLAITNDSDEVIVVTEVSGTFLAQKEALGQWILLDSRPSGKPSGSEAFTIRPEDDGIFSFIVDIPLDMPGLYINAYGDINLKVTHEIKVAVDDEAAALMSSGDSLYWVTPGTSKWVLREGM
ncbi:MAG: hypothetical protein PVJ36_03090 [Nitrospirota bacterium]